MGYTVSFNTSGFAHCREILMLTLDKREFVYEFNYEIIQPTSNANLVDFFVADWSDINNFKELQAEANRRAITNLTYLFIKIMFVC